MISRNKKESKKGIKKSGEACIVCGWSENDLEGNTLVVGAHIRPFHTGDEFDKADNIIALCPNHHAEFDKYNFYIDENEKKLVFCYDSEYNGKDVSEKTIQDWNGEISYLHICSFYFPSFNS